MVYNIFLEISLLGVFILTFFIVLLAFQGGVFLGRKHRVTSEHEDRAPVGSIVGSTLGLLAFLLAFTFGLAATRFDDRRGLVVEEANAIGTTFLRAEYIVDPYRTRIKNLLKDYVTLRLNALTTEKLTEGVKRSEELQDQLWLQAVSVAEKYPNSVMVGLFIQSLNEVIDLHTKRVTMGIRIRIPVIIWSALFFVAILSIGSLGYQFGLTRVCYLGVTLLLLLIFSTVIALIADLDRPQEGFIKVSQQPLIDLSEKFNRAIP